MEHGTTSLVDILISRAENQPDKLSYRFLRDGEYDEVCITYKALDQRARCIGARLQACTKAGERALLLFPAGLDFIAAYFGCLYARVIAIPAYPPHAARIEKSLPVIFRIADDAQPSAALMTSLLYNAIVSRNDFSAGFADMKLLVTDENDLDDWADKWQHHKIDRNDIAFLQYSSGSTSSPKGVMVSHDNLLHNLCTIENAMELTDKSVGVFWLPPYHDMGLIGSILQALYTGYPVTLMSHLMFLQRPIRWLKAITRFQATTSGGPNFAYDLCVRRIKPAEREQLNFSTWEVAVNGAEPIHHKTLNQFADFFAPCGFRREAFFPCYGLAEATLMVTGSVKGKAPDMQNLMSSGLEQNKAIFSRDMGSNTQTLVSCGKSPGEQKIRIVNPETSGLCAWDEIGEIWVSGPSVTSGYWNNPTTTVSTFGSQLPTDEECAFLRTGDLGFLHNGRLYITGRLKDLIIIDGKNHYPHDIERTVEESSQAVVPGGCAVFSVNNAGSESVVVMAETERNYHGDLGEVVKAIRAFVSGHHGLFVSDVKLVPFGNIPRTTSGKIRHFLCKKIYLEGALTEIA
ncbi:MAG: fatty acyl-AMP ligase [Ginsengibacter sp.]